MFVICGGGQYWDLFQPNELVRISLIKQPLVSRAINITNALDEPCYAGPVRLFTLVIPIVNRNSAITNQQLFYYGRRKVLMFMAQFSTRRWRCFRSEFKLIPCSLDNNANLSYLTN